MTCDVRLEHLLGLPAVYRGQSQGHVERAVLEDNGHALRGLLIRRGFFGAKWVARQDIELLGDVSVILRKRPVRTPPDTDFRLKTVKDTRGATLGCVTDAFLSPEDLHVSGIEITLGLLEDLRSGRRQVQQFSALPSGEVLIPAGELLLAEKGRRAGAFLPRES